MPPENRGNAPETLEERRKRLADMKERFYAEVRLREESEASRPVVIAAPPKPGRPTLYPWHEWIGYADWIEVYQDGSEGSDHAMGGYAIPTNVEKFRTYLYNYCRRNGLRVETLLVSQYPRTLAFRTCPEGEDFPQD